MCKNYEFVVGLEKLMNTLAMPAEDVPMLLLNVVHAMSAKRVACFGYEVTTGEVVLGSVTNLTPEHVEQIKVDLLKAIAPEQDEPSNVVKLHS